MNEVFDRVTLVEMENIELPSRDSSLAISMLHHEIPAISSMGEKQCEVQGHPLGIEIRDGLKLTTSLLQYQVMWLTVCQDTDLLQVQLGIVATLMFATWSSFCTYYDFPMS